MDFTIGALIDRNVVNSTSYGSVDVFINVNHFRVSQGTVFEHRVLRGTTPCMSLTVLPCSLQAEAFLNTTHPLTLEFPVSIPGTGVSPATDLIFFLNEGTFDVDFLIELTVCACISSIESSLIVPGTNGGPGTWKSHLINLCLAGQRDVSAPLRVSSTITTCEANTLSCTLP